MTTVRAELQRLLEQRLRDGNLALGEKLFRQPVRHGGRCRRLGGNHCLSTGGNGRVRLCELRLILLPDGHTFLNRSQCAGLRGGYLRVFEQAENFTQRGTQPVQRLSLRQLPDLGVGTGSIGKLSLREQGVGSKAKQLGLERGGGIGGQLGVDLRKRAGELPSFHAIAHATQHAGLRHQVGGIRRAGLAKPPRIRSSPHKNGSTPG